MSRFAACSYYVQVKFQDACAASPPNSTLLYLLLDHELVALHHDLQLVPSRSVLPKLINPTASNGAEQAVFTLSSSKQWLNLQTQQRRRRCRG